MFGLLRSQLLYNVSILKRRMAYYAVAKGRQVGIYDNWAQCQQQVNGFKGAIYKKFNTRQEAEQFINPAGATANYAPDEVAVALGQRQPPPASWAPRQEYQQKRHEAKPKDFWPEDVVQQQEVTDEDLVGVMEEVEGFPTQSGSRKRKLQSNNSGTYKIPRHTSNADEPVALKQIGAFEFTLNAEGYVIVYTDGSCLGNGRKDACAGFGVYFGDNHQLNAAKPVLGRVTNNVGEIQAAIYAIKTALDLGIKKLSINTDSQFLINSITKWVPGWKKRGWRLPNMEPVKNVVDFKELDELLQSKEINVNWNYVEAHKGIKGNEMADKLARQGSQLYKELNCKN
ncbi:ribonuclease H1 [Drosophila novamexicana]|uniref:ribonuclease H1 n=1 Tax=Drosophila novamexicana TaxID=47314 RepID=UPI0011E5A7B2|nr:ribonuclease H1 [Drosophila novamexicana]